MKNIVLFALFSSLAVGAQEKTPETEKAVTGAEVYFPVDWRSIKPNGNPIPKFVSIEGYLGFDGTGDFPRIILWETDEARKQQMVFRRVFVDSASASPLIIKRFGSGVNSWKVLEGLFVSIEGILEIEPDESRHLFIGDLKSIRSIAVKNNGMNLFEIR